MPNFTAHNIRLDDGSLTLPSAPCSIDETTLCKAFVRVIRMVFPGHLAGKRIADIGCLEGGYTTEFARLGMTATGIEVRESNMENCRHVKEQVDLPNLEFIKDDAMNIGQHGPFDMLFICGLLYHLDKPLQFLQDASRVCGKAIIVDTHVAPIGHEIAVRTFNLSPTQTNEGLKGRWSMEFEDTTPDALDAMKWSSYSNNKSFWLQKVELVQALKTLGFDTVFELYDVVDDIVGEFTGGYRASTSRVCVVGVRSDP